MIKQILAACMLATVMANPVFANFLTRNNDPVPVEVNNIRSIKKLSIYGDADVMLVPDASSGVSIIGDKEGAEKLKLIYQNDRLEIVASNFSINKKNVVRIPSKDLERIEINGDGRVYSEVILTNSNLDVLVNGICNVELRSHGKIKVYASPEFELKFTKNEVVKIINGTK